MLDAVSFAVFGNLVTAISIVFINKFIFADFEYESSLTCFHLVVTWLGLHLMRLMGLFQSKPMGLRQSLLIGLTYALCMPAQNLALRLNSVGSYQVAKICLMPATVVCDRVLANKTPSNGVLFSLVLICGGAVVSTVTDASFTSVGTAASVLMVSSTAMNQIAIQEATQKLKMSSPQLLLKCLPFALVLVTPILPLLEDWSKHNGPIGFEYTPHTVALIGASGGLAVLVNLTTFMIIGKASAITYRVLTHAKTIIIFIGNFVLFKQQHDIRNILGTAITFLGVVCYTYAKLAESAPAMPPQGDKGLQKTSNNNKNKKK